MNILDFADKHTAACIFLAAFTVFYVCHAAAACAEQFANAVDSWAHRNDTDEPEDET